MPDLQLWNEFRQGNKLAYKKIYENYIHILYDYGCSLSNDTVLVEDCIQDLFLALWERKNDIEITSSVKFYLFTSIRRLIIKAIKKNTNSLHLIPSDDIVPDQDIKTNRLKAIRSVITKLPKQQRKAIELRFFHGFDYDEISLIMNISIASVYNLIAKAITSLKKAVLN